MTAVDQPRGAWTFDADVAAEFDSHVAASVPYYRDIQALVAEVADWALPDGSLFADLGASAGTTSLGIASRQSARDIRHVLYDVSSPMLLQAEARLSAAGVTDAQFHSADVTKGLLHRDADLTVALFTLQFVPTRERRAVLVNARQASAWGGMLLVAEKVAAEDARWHEIGSEVSWDRKLEAGLDADHVLTKAASLRGVLNPVTSKALEEELENAGWQSVACLFRWHQWVVYGAFNGRRR